MSSPFALGWRPDLESAARSARLPLFTAARFGDDRPLPPAFSLARFRKWPFDQGQVGSCFSNAGAQFMQIHTAADNAAGANWEEVQLSRRLIWHQCRKLDGSLGSGADGGSITNTLAAIGPAPDGVGDCREAAWPYKPDHRWLEETPPEAVIAEAGQNRVTQVADVRVGDEWQRSIFNGHGVVIGIFWFFSWDQQGATFITHTGQGDFGHALVVIGWLVKDGTLFWQIENSHGPIYAPLPSDVAARVPGYVPAYPDKTHDFWVSDSALKEAIGRGNAESITAAGLSGFKGRDLLQWQDLMS